MMTVNLGTSAQATAITIFAPSLAIPPASYSRPTMKPVMFWRKTSGILRWRGELDEMGALERRRAEQDAVVGDDPDRIALDVGEAGDERLPVARLEVVEAAAVDEAGDDLADLDRAGADPPRPRRRGRPDRPPGRPPAARLAGPTAAPAAAG